MENENKVPYETKFKDGTEITDYLATAYAEGFCEGENASDKDRICAWSYLCGTKLGFKLQGWFGRTINNLIENGLLDENGKVDWEEYNCLIQG